ncbi:hypothetical protein [Gluconacetobacter tumulicola]|uniref:Uncharacterized protein n=1 Tax=Gluconacetobacter tumulicola TaxID=1017177 RepID=A0A7W4P886_9PROT|nr:hypothetical protein [Gluconacetobacter tumulicola]MBB2181226.1 hypothetical protein [Gluconacetobacter tumulicola]
MKLVTLANIQFNRIGTLGPGRGGFPSYVSSGDDRRITVCVELENSTSAAVLEKVKEIAIQKGEHEQDLRRLGQQRDYGADSGGMSFKEDLDVWGTQYSSTYADCEVFPAFEIDGRYFRLQEVQKSDL